MAEMESNDPGRTEPLSALPGNPNTSPVPVVPPPRKRRRRLVLKIVGVLALLFVLLIVALPSILSTGAARSIIVGQINNRLNGKVDIASLSLGWFTGINLQGVRVFDSQSAQIAELDHLTVPYPLWKAVTGKFALGDVVVDGLSFDARYDQQGNLNFSQLAKSTETATPSPAAAEKSSTNSSRLPDLSGNFKLVNCRGTVSKFGQPTLYLTRLDGEVKIPDINQPITDQLIAAVRVGNQPEGNITLAGTAAVISKNEMALDTGEVHQKLTATNIDLQSLKPFLPGSFEKLYGTIGIQLAADLTAGKNAELDLSITASKPIAIGGPILDGDTFTTNQFEIAFPKVTAVFPDGAGHWQSGRIKTDGDAHPVLVKIDQGQVTLLADLTAQAILNLMDNQKPGSAGQVAIASNFDLPRIFPQLKHLIPQQPGTTLASGDLSENITLAMTPESAVLSEKTASTRLVGTRAVASGPAEAISIDPIELSLNATDHGGGGVLPVLQKMDLKIASKSANGEFSGETLSNLNGSLTIKLDVLREELNQFLDLKDKALSGVIVVKMSEQELPQAPFKRSAQLIVTVIGLHYADAVTHQKIDQPLVELDANADLQGSAKQTVEKINKLLVTLKTGSTSGPTIASFSVTDATLPAATTSLLNQFTTAHFDLDVPNLKPVMELANSFSAPVPTPAVTTAKPDPAAPAPVPPMEYTGGALVISGDLAHEGSKLKLTVSKAAATGVAFRRGTVTYAAKPITAGLTISIDTGDGKSLMEQIRQVEFQQLRAELGIATLSMSAPIIISQLASHPTANGSIKLVGNLTDLTTLLTAMQGEKPEALPYRGDYTLDEKIGSQQGTLSLKGGMQIAKLQSFNGSITTFSEDLFALTNDLALTPAGDDESVTLNDLSVSMKSSGALQLNLKSGSIGKLLTERNLQLQPTVDYDLVKLWPVIQPMMGDKYKTLKITGAFKKQFNITGSYPAGQPFTAAIKTLHADGDLAVATFDYNGLNLQSFIVPFTLDNGKLVTVYANKPAGQNTAPPAIANSGTLDLSNWMIDLTQDPPRLNIPDNKPIISKLMVNPLFANSYLANFLDNSAFRGNNGASGLFDCISKHCVDVPMGDLATRAVPANTGKADLIFSLTNLQIGFEGIPDLEKILKDTTFTANVKDATVSIARGFSTQHISFVTGRYSMTFDGRVRLADQMYVPQLTCSIGPFSEIAQRVIGIHDENVLGQLKEPFAIAIHGTVESPHVDLKKVFNDAKDLVGKLVVKGLLGGKGNNPLGGLLDKATKKK